MSKGKKKKGKKGKKKFVFVPEGVKVGNETVRTRSAVSRLIRKGYPHVTSIVENLGKLANKGLFTEEHTKEMMEAGHSSVVYSNFDKFVRYNLHKGIRQKDIDKDLREDPHSVLGNLENLEKQGFKIKPEDIRKVWKKGGVYAILDNIKELDKRGLTKELDEDMLLDLLRKKNYLPIRGNLDEIIDAKLLTSNGLAKLVEEGKFIDFLKGISKHEPPSDIVHNLIERGLVDKKVITKLIEKGKFDKFLDIAFAGGDKEAVMDRALLRVMSKEHVAKLIDKGKLDTLLSRIKLSDLITRGLFGSEHILQILKNGDIDFVKYRKGMFKKLQLWTEEHEDLLDRVKEKLKKKKKKK